LKKTKHCHLNAEGQSFLSKSTNCSIFLFLSLIIAS
jgi:hypothetical protein